MNITIIGCGYVGFAVAKSWNQKMTFVVTATTTTPERLITLQTVAQRTLLLKGNDAEGLKSVLKNQDVVLLSIGSKKGSTYEETYLETAKTLVTVLQKSSVKQLIYTSSCSVYGDQNGRLVDEETPINPTSPNSKTLAETEQLLLSASSDNLKVCILRLGGIYGVNRELVKIYSRIAGTIRPGTGDEPANWIHLDDIVAGIEFARKHHFQGIYNLVDDANLTSREIIDKVCETHNLDKVTWDASQKSNRPYNARISNQKIKDAGYKFVHPQMIF
jgi:nucleoside-diphosphate-sugar epimerase